MKLFFLLIFSTTFSFLSCKDFDKKQTTKQYKDSIAIKYINQPIRDIEFDSSIESFKVLKAYIENDTAYLQEINDKIEYKKKFEKQWENMDSCIHQTKLSEMNIDEGYRFIYTGAFCRYRQITTIYKKKDSVKLNFSLYQFKWDTADCYKIEEYEKSLTIKNWENFIEEIRKGDFWGLQKENGIQGFDGSNLIVMGFTEADTFNRKPMRYSYVHRWEYTTLRDALDSLTILAANKNGCYMLRKL